MSTTISNSPITIFMNSLLRLRYASKIKTRFKFDHVVTELVRTEEYLIYLWHKANHKVIALSKISSIQSRLHNVVVHGNFWRTIRGSQ
ncbi:uncharacterized protein M6B38_319700 [Iris pallida]|uniref:Uncharacterized protein n=1 Tax=Iris pallida TaxID=29817 RepID=A0AAX6HCM5_IRIPA|nr:uncharacterized protein M6B38_319700 [Iris pallida]